MPIGVYPRGKFTLQEFFWQRVFAGTSEACWEWRGSMFSTGYGEARGQTAHRVSWQVNRGAIPEGSHVLHTCDNRKCVNPAHLYLGNDADNRRDACARSRYPGNARSSRAKLTLEQVVKMKQEAKELLISLSREKAAKELAKTYPLSSYSIRQILAGVRWSHVQIGE